MHPADLSRPVHADRPLDAFARRDAAPGWGTTMQGPKSILVPLDASPSARERLATAKAFARRHGGVVLGMYAGSRRHAVLPRIEHLHHRGGYDAQRAHDARHHVQAWFDGETRRADRPAMQWLEADAANPDDALAR